MAHLETIRRAVTGSFRNPRLWVIQFAANPILFLIFTVWLRLAVESNWQVALNATLGILFAASVLVLHGGTLNYFRGAYGNVGATLRSAFLRAFGNLLAIAIWVTVLCLVWMLLDKANLDTYQQSLPAYLRSVLPVFVRRHTSLAFLTNAFEACVFAARWILIPGLLLPLLQSASELGLRGFGKHGFLAWRRAVLSYSYWLLLVVAVLLGLVATAKIMALTPNFDTSTLRHEAISLVARLALAYLLVLFSWMLTCSLLGGIGAGPVGTRR